MQGDSKPEPEIAWAIYEAVRTPIAQKLWDQDKCVTPPIPAALTGSPAGGAATPVVIMRIDAK